MIRVVIIGSGNVAQHLIKSFAKSNIIQIVQAFSRHKESLKNIIDYSKITSNFSSLVDADVYIISVSDNAIAEVSHQLNLNNKLVVHTSGSINITNLDDKNRKGVFYPLQTFSKNAAINFNEIPICVEAENESDYKLLETVARSISKKVFQINSNQRKILHVSAVFVNNFVNHLYKIGNDICTENNIPFEILQPLIQETANKISLLSPDEAQTGPAKRNDTQTINAHLHFLTNENQKEIYKILTKSIIDNGKKL
ncbi:DUF2520 domain-containing protein [Flavobacterium psychrophilum]|uniref:Rossmann-like and DUF2520 domain-containing protein n=1 Tax=Flavobacterium psychrophilum TaxID=96345 RepID=UPI000B7C1CE5|nr:Rossmann-like and DUF2520 domain-containing protein [Flavobacterium psychrophilum]ELY1979662.1 DUF2520 domain-containing protein [Flavobacterium psychrophilum]QRE62064.1 DUF2520 domain-containing protein [Flavobacterium psychrophilum]QRE64253.1 DUF2520 domain-containing protein [Flavobacterium psychrophilum]SNB38091.1 conserved hypothetical protein [Flavobacterium psychrophilum]